jgi:hypothetical protein
MVLLDQLSGEFAPDTVVPFAISREQAQAILEAWLVGKRYLAPEFYSKLRQDPLIGVYFPYIVIDADLETTAEGGGSFPDSVSHRVWASGQIQIENLIQPALRATRADQVMNRLQPWDLRRQVPFTPGYLAGFQTERRDLDFADVATETAVHADMAARCVLATQVFKAYDRCSLLKLWGFSTVRRHRHHHTLLPAWVVYYLPVEGELRYFGVNGQTGEAVGSLPVDLPKLNRHAAGFGALLGLAVVLFFGGAPALFGATFFGLSNWPVAAGLLVLLGVGALAGLLARHIVYHSVLKKYGLMRREDPRHEGVGWAATMTTIRAEGPKDDSAVAAKYAAAGWPAWAMYGRPKRDTPGMLANEMFWAPDGKTATGVNRRGIITFS